MPNIYLGRVVWNQINPIKYSEIYFFFLQIKKLSPLGDCLSKLEVYKVRPLACRFIKKSLSLPQNCQ